MVAVQGKDCSRMQRRFWACLLLLACICLFVVCIAVPPFAITISRPGWPIGHTKHIAIKKHWVMANALREGENVAANASARLLQMRRKPRRFSRKLLVAGNYSGEEWRPSPAAATKDKVERMGDDGCSMEDIAIVQGEIGPMPDGIPSFAVQILNLCLSGCPIRDIHVSCGWFASATLVNPALFKRVGFDDCVVKEGHALAAGETLSFQYANSFQYPFSLSSASFSCP